MGLVWFQSEAGRAEAPSDGSGMAKSTGVVVDGGGWQVVGEVKLVPRPVTSIVEPHE